MSDPVIASDGHTYERKTIQRWRQKNNTSPVICEVLKNKDLLPNYLVKSQRLGRRSSVARPANSTKGRSF